MSNNNSITLAKEMDWLKSIVERRMNITMEKTYSENGGIDKRKYVGISDLQPPRLNDEKSEYANAVGELNLSLEDRLLLIMSLAHHLQPDFFDRLILTNSDYAAAQKDPGRYKTRFNELGGISGDNFRGFIPTGLTWLFLLAGHNMNKRIELMTLINKNNPLFAKKIISISEAKDFEPIMSGAITIAHDWLRYLIVGDIEIKESLSVLEQ